jgi:sulfate adenylyltransferase subunit 2
MIEQKIQLWRIPENHVSQELLDKKITLLRDRLHTIQQNHRIVRFATSLAVEDVVLTDAIATNRLAIQIFTLDTGRLHRETQEMIGRCESQYQISIEIVVPDENDVADFTQQFGINGFYDSEQAKKACCHARKVEPLNKILKGADAWLTGQRKEQSVTRGELEFQEFDIARDMQKFNPLFDWTQDEIWAYVKTRGVPVHPLHKQGYASIGCDPCTRAIRENEDVRAGRWWWLQSESKECGLHVTPAVQQQAAKIIEKVSQVNNPLPTINNDYLDWLEAESIYIIREVVGQCANPAMLFSGGKDSIVMFHLARKAFRFGARKIKIPFPLVHIDTGHNYAEVIQFRDEIVAKTGSTLIIGHVEDSIRKGTVKLRKETDSRNAAQATTLLETIAEHRFDALMGGARRDEEKARAKERIFSFRDEFGQWDPKAQRPELWRLYNARISSGEHMRVFPISNWTELDIWQYIAREKLELPSIYYTHKREVVQTNGLLVPVTPITPKSATDVSELIDVRFRTVGDISCTCPVASTAATPEDIIRETALSEITERGATRMDDQTSEASMERRKKEGYF